MAFQFVMTPINIQTHRSSPFPFLAGDCHDSFLEVVERNLVQEKIHSIHSDVKGV